MSKKWKFVKEVPKKLYSTSLGPKSKRIAVLGAFDTWPYMHKICTEVVKSGHVAITSRFIYKKNKNTTSGYYRKQWDTDKKSMNDFLRENVVGYSDAAIIVYSVPGAHYNEAEWCFLDKIKTLGIAFVRDIKRPDFCEDNIWNIEDCFSYCNGKGDAWDCISKKQCPFKIQEIAKTQLEYFLRSEKMTLICVEKVEKITKIIKDFINNELELPLPIPYIFQFRFDIPEEKNEELFKKIKKTIKEKEDYIRSFYEYIDYYYKPNAYTNEQWLEKNRALRIRESKDPIERTVDVYANETNRTKLGFYCSDPFKQGFCFSNTKKRVKQFLEDHNMDLFLKVIKKGIFSEIEHNEIKIYLENIEFMEPGKNKESYGYSFEIELLVKDPENLSEIEKSKKQIIKKFGLEKCKQQIVPVQEMVYTRILENKK